VGIVKLHEHDVPLGVSANSVAPQPGVRPATKTAGEAGLALLANQLGLWPRKSALSIVRFVDKTLVIAELEARKLRHEPTELLTRAVQPALWLLVFGQVFSRVRAIPTGNVSYLDFMAPGVLAQSVLFISIFYGIGIIWERDLGILHKFLAAPVPRSALVLGKALSAGVRALSQAVIVFGLAVLLGVDVSFRPLDLLGVVVTVILGAALFSSFSLIIACLVKTRERFMGIGQVLTMPLFFASNAIYPIAMMPAWLQTIARLNPLTYEVDALRTFMLATGVSVYGVGQDLLILTVVTAGLVVIGGRLYPTVI
jgi:ABC-2 type transport system permease protein